MSLLVDANVLIDYCDTEPSILLAYSTEIQQIVVPSVVLAEVHQLNENTCTQLELRIIEESLPVLIEASEGTGALSFEDRVCLILCTQNDWTCATNDKRLHGECGSRNVPTIWGLRILTELVSVRALESKVALDIAERMRENNPFCYSNQILTDFRAIIAGHETRRRD